MAFSRIFRCRIIEGIEIIFTNKTQQRIRYSLQVSNDGAWLGYFSTVADLEPISMTALLSELMPVLCRWELLAVQQGMRFQVVRKVVSVVKYMLR